MRDRRAGRNGTGQTARAAVTRYVAVASWLVSGCYFGVTNSGAARNGGGAHVITSWRRTPLALVAPLNGGSNVHA